MLSRYPPKGLGRLEFGLVERFVKEQSYKGQYDITYALAMKAITR